MKDEARANMMSSSIREVERVVDELVNSEGTRAEVCSSALRELGIFRRAFIRSTPASPWFKVRLSFL
jgi:hypothetical protein